MPLQRGAGGSKSVGRTTSKISVRSEDRRTLDSIASASQLGSFYQARELGASHQTEPIRISKRSKY